VSGTLHAAVFFAGLEVLERRPHSRPSSYIKLGLDAAVSYPTLNFRFRNDRPFPVAITMTIEGGWVTATVLGAEQTHQVSFVRRIDEAIAFEEREVEDPALPRGVRVLQQRGVPGFKVSRWRIIRDMVRNQAVRQPLTDEYPPTSQIWRVGSGAENPEFEAPPGDEHMEYTADEYLSITQGAGIEGELEAKRAGRYGYYGWMVAEGFAEAPPEEADAL
jgi:hypothetical protein